MKYLGYCRKSTDEPDRQILSIEAQVAELKEFAAKEKLEIVDFILENKPDRLLSIMPIIGWKRFRRNPSMPMRRGISFYS